LSIENLIVYEQLEMIEVFLKSDSSVFQWNILSWNIKGMSLHC